MLTPRPPGFLPYVVSRRRNRCTAPFVVESNADPTICITQRCLCHRREHFSEISKLLSQYASVWSEVSKSQRQSATHAFFLPILRLLNRYLQGALDHGSWISHGKSISNALVGCAPYASHTKESCPLHVYHLSGRLKHPLRRFCSSPRRCSTGWASTGRDRF